MFVDEINDRCEDAEPFMIGNFSIAQGYWSENAHLPDEYLQRVLITFEGDFGGFEYVPAITEEEADNLRDN